MQSNIISLSGVQCAGKSVVAEHLKSLIPNSVIYDGKRELKRYLNNPDKNGIVIIVEYASSILFPVGHLNSVSTDRFLKCGLIDRRHFQKGKHFFLDLQSEKTQHKRLLERTNGTDNEYNKIIGREYVYRSQYLRMLSNRGYFTKTICVDEKSIEEISQVIMDTIT